MALPQVGTTEVGFNDLVLHRVPFIFLKRGLRFFSDLKTLGMVRL